MSSPGPPYRLSVTPAVLDRVGPRVGQHTRDVLRRWAGMSNAEVDALVAWCEHGPAFASVQHVHVVDEHPQGAIVFRIT